MTDVRALLRNERAARRISHPHATYSTTGTLVCLVCHIQLKSESLWNGHLRSPQHSMRLQRIRDGTLGRPPGAPALESQGQSGNEQNTQDLDRERDAKGGQVSELVGSQSRKRKAEEDDGIEDSAPKRGKSKVQAEGLSGGGAAGDIKPSKSSTGRPSSVGQEIQLPSRPATPQKVSQAGPTPAAAAHVDEDEWAAFEADIAATVVTGTVISAPAMSAAEVAAKAEENVAARRKEETDDDKEDAVRKLEVEFDEMEALEERVRRLKEKRESLRLKSGVAATTATAEKMTVPSPVEETTKTAAITKNEGVLGADGEKEEDEDEDEDEDDDYDESNASGSMSPGLLLHNFSSYRLRPS